MTRYFDLAQTSYWLLLVWLFGAGIVLYKMPKKSELVCGQLRERYYWFTALLLVAPYILWTGYRSIAGDTYTYALLFRKAAASFSAIPGTLFSDTKDPGFTALMIFAKACGIRDYQHFFLLIAAFQMFCMVYTFRRYSSNYWFSFFLFIASTDYVSWMQNGMRQFLAVCMTFAAFDLMVKRKYIRFALIVLVAMQIHGSAVIMLPIAYAIQGKPLNRKTMLIIIGTALCMPFIDWFMPILENIMAETQYSDIMTNEIWSADDGTNILRVAVYSAPALMVFLGRRYVIHSDDPAINQCINASILTMALYLVSMVTSGIYIGRLPIYTTLHGYMLLPWIIDQVFEKTSAKFVKLMIILCYIGFFYYQLGISWDML